MSELPCTSNKKTFAIVGVGGYVASRHLRAIQLTGNKLVAALDPSDSVGILDSYFPEAKFFTEFERFDRHIEKLKRTKDKVDYISICSPNYLHDAHIRFALRVGADAICEKPVVINPWNIEALKELEKEYGKRVNVIQQLRLHPEIKRLKEKIGETGGHKIKIRYITPRGEWYHTSWKGNKEKSGGLLMNIGVHFLDTLLWIFGHAHTSENVEIGKESASGILKFERAEAEWYLSISREDGKHRTFLVDGENYDFTAGFEDLHTRSYEEILNGKGFGLDNAYRAIELIHRLGRTYVEKT